MDHLQERAHQILNMRQIFQGASRVLVWLGEEPSDCHGALHFLEKVTCLADLDDDLCGNNTAVSWKAVRSVLLQPYFTRAWVVQEIAVARRAIIHLGSESIDWKIFVAAISIFDMRSLLYPAELPDYDKVKLQGASRFVRTVRRCFRRDEFGNAQEPVLSLEKLVFELSDCHASDPRDKIYAFLAIASDIHLELEQPLIRPDYQKPAYKVYADFYRFCLSSSKSLDVIFRPWGQSQPPPEWLLQTSSSELESPLVQTPSEPPLYRTGLIPATSDLQLSDASILKLSGFEFDCIETATIPNDEWDVPLPRSWLKKVAPSQVIPALLSECSPEYKDLETDLIDCFQQVFEASSNNEEFSTMISASTRLTLVFKQIKFLTQSRVLIKTAQRSIIGLAPIGTQKGDLICFTPSCSVPIILRKLDVFTAEGDQQHGLVGACYVSGYMKGEFRNVSIEENLPLGRFEIIPTDKWPIRYIMFDKLAESDSSSSSSIGFVLGLQDDSANLSKELQRESSVSERNSQDVAIRGIRLQWTCKCGHKGFDHYIEYQRGSVNQLIIRLKAQGMLVSTEPWDPFDISSGVIQTAILRGQITAANLWNHYIVAMAKTVFQKNRPLEGALKLQTPALTKTTLHSNQNDKEDANMDMGTAIEDNTEKTPLLETVPATKSKPILDRLGNAIKSPSISTISAASGSSGNSGNTPSTGNTGTAGSTQSQTPQA